MCRVWRRRTCVCVWVWVCFSVSVRCASDKAISATWTCCTVICVCPISSSSILFLLSVSTVRPLRLETMMHETEDPKVCALRTRTTWIHCYCVFVVRCEIGTMWYEVNYTRCGKVAWISTNGHRLNENPSIFPILSEIDNDASRAACIHWHI